ncbi:hypothetical protein [Tomitella gaofuii]|uniref:hypothetical protein n=1 Tax=Tomitella gaofuii TaxID=2760083 RepID=UPI0015FDDB61|nr:hypothetical protein [Tomitella gaofuii]
MVGKFESRKDIAQELTESTAVRVGRIATIITTCVRDVAREVGDMLTDGLELRDAARRAREDEHERSREEPIQEQRDGETGQS